MLFVYIIQYTQCYEKNIIFTNILDVGKKLKKSLAQCRIDKEGQSGDVKPDL